MSSVGHLQAETMGRPCFSPLLNFPHVLPPIHSLLCFFYLPITFSAASLYITKILLCPSSESSVSPSLWNLFFTSMLCLLLISSLRSLHTSNLTLAFSFPCAFANFILILVLTRWWSLYTSAPLITFVSGIDALMHPFTKKWSIWLTVFPSSDFQVSLWIYLCGKTAPVTTYPFVRTTEVI